MLRFALENAPGVNLLLDDARTFSMPAQFHLVVSMFDSLNHVLTMEELTAVFRKVFASLVTGGLFLFDLNIEEGYKINWRGSFGIVEVDHTCVIRSSYNPDEQIGRWEATIFRLNPNWKRSDVVLLQKSYSETEIRLSVQDAGFENIAAYAFDKQAGFQDLTQSSPRAFFLCSKL